MSAKELGVAENPNLMTMFHDIPTIPISRVFMLWRAVSSLDKQTKHQVDGNARRRIKNDNFSSGWNHFPNCVPSEMSGCHERDMEIYANSEPFQTLC